MTIEHGLLLAQAFIIGGLVSNAVLQWKWNHLQMQINAIARKRLNLLSGVDESWPVQGQEQSKP